MLMLRGLCVFVLYLSIHFAEPTCFLEVRVNQGCRRLRRSLLVPLSSSQENESSDELPTSISQDHFYLGDRRKVLLTMGLVPLASCIPNSAAASFVNFGDVVAADINALSDLPPIAPDSVRLLLCRHGQTEYNRLKLVQGSRIDAALNEKGQRQAERLGNALAAAYPLPEQIFHSPLIRAKQTAALASQQFNTTKPQLKMLPELTEIDFGGVEGASVDEVRTRMVAAYSAWAVGNIDTRMARDGESLREILLRIQKALAVLTRAAQGCESRCIAAVAHSSYLRILLAVVQELPLVQASIIDQRNCCVNVVDFKLMSPPAASRVILPTSKTFGGAISQAPKTFELEVPIGTVLRTGETRHLGDLAL